MRRLESILASIAILAGVAACCCPVQLGPQNVPPIVVGNQPPPPPVPPRIEDDPAEQPIVEAIKANGGWVKKEKGQVFEAVLKDADANLLAQLAGLPRLRTLSIRGNLDAAGFKHLVGLNELADLDLWGAKIDDAGLKVVACLTQLKRLGLRGAKTTDQGLVELAPLKQLEELEIGGGNTTNTAGVNIAKHLNHLQRLRVDNSGFGDVGLIALADMPNLRLLHIYSTQITDGGLAVLPKIKSLEDLAVGWVSNASLKSIGACTNLRSLKLFNARITDKGLEELDGLTQLTYFEVRNSVFGGASNDGVARFMKTHPKCSVVGPN